MTSTLPRHAIISRLTTAIVTYMPLFYRTYGRKPFRGTAINTDTEDEFLSTLRELSGKYVVAVVEYDICEGEHRSGIDILRQTVLMAERDFDYIPPNEFYVQGHPVERSDEVNSLIARMDRLREERS